jgi:hypothetical protein
VTEALLATHGAAEIAVESIIWEWLRRHLPLQNKDLDNDVQDCAAEIVNTLQLQVEPGEVDGALFACRRDGVRRS